MVYNAAMLRHHIPFVNDRRKVRIFSMHNSAEPIYLDHAATTIVDPRVANLIFAVMSEDFGNAGSRTHGYGLAALRHVSAARAQVARGVAADPSEVVFTSGATESDNLATLGFAEHGIRTGLRHIVSTAIEHKAILEPLARLEDQGFEVTRVRPGREGHVSAASVLDAVRADTLLVSVMHANNETGAIQPIGEIAGGLAEDGPFLHVDAAQTVGRATDALRSNRIDLISISGHKVFGPKGVGALITRRRRGVRPPLAPIMVGGGQESGLRPGTLPVPLIAGFGLAVELACREEVARRSACEKTRAAALDALAALDPLVHGDPALGVLPNILSIALPGIDSEALMVALRDVIAISNGSACTSSRYEPSHVLTAMGLDADEVGATVRISWAHNTGQIPWAAIVDRLVDLKI